VKTASGIRQAVWENPWTFSDAPLASVCTFLAITSLQYDKVTYIGTELACEHSGVIYKSIFILHRLLQALEIVVVNSSSPSFLHIACAAQPTFKDD
jgi:hypothetical protein